MAGRPMITGEGVNDFFRRKGYDDPDSLSDYERLRIFTEHVMHFRPPWVSKKFGGLRKKPDAPAKS